MLHRAEVISGAIAADPLRRQHGNDNDLRKQKVSRR
jgi:hypothetical protein